MFSHVSDNEAYQGISFNVLYLVKTVLKKRRSCDNPSGWLNACLEMNLHHGESIHKLLITLFVGPIIAWRRGQLVHIEHTPSSNHAPILTC